jgi:DNA-binding transcriptional LysR family regulator
MHRFVHRFLGDRTPAFSYSTDGAEMGKLMVAEGLGVTVLPDFSVINDPLERSGTITYRPLRPRQAEVLLVVQRRRSSSMPQALRDLYRMFVARGRASHREPNPIARSPVAPA